MTNKVNKLPAVVLISFIFLVPIVRCIWFFDSYLIKLWLVQFGMAFLFLYFIYQTVIKRARFQLFGTSGFLLFAYLAVNIISWLLVASSYKYPALLTLAAFCTYILLCFFTAQYLRSRGLQSIAVLVWITVTIGVCIYALSQYFCHDRVIGTLGNENFLASHLGITIPVCIGYFLQYKNANKKILYLGAGALILFLVTLYLTHSRGAWLGLIGSLGFFTITVCVERRKRALVLALLILAVAMSLFTPRVTKFVAKQFCKDVRPAIWEGTMYMITEKPLLGWGKGAYFIFYPEYRIQEYWDTKCPTDLTIHAHNEFLQIGAETGLIGLCLFLALVYTVVKLGVENADRQKGGRKYLLLGITSAIIGLMIHNLFCNNLQMPSSAIFFWMMIGMVLSYGGEKETVLKVDVAIGRRIFLALALFSVIIIWLFCIKPVVAQYLFKRGWNYRAKEDWRSAIVEYNKAMAWYKWDVEMHYRTAYAYTVAGDNDKAIEEYNNVLKMTPLYGLAHRNMGIIYMKKGDYREAERSFLMQLRIDEDDSIARSNLRRIKDLDDVTEKER